MGTTMPAGEDFGFWRWVAGNGLATWLAAIGTMLAVFVALFKEKILAPKLTVMMPRPQGVLTKRNNGQHAWY